MDYKLNFPGRAFFILLSFIFFQKINAQSPEGFRVVGYYFGPTRLIDSFETNKLTHLIFSFGHLEGNRLRIGSASDSTTIKRMVQLKSKDPSLKIMLSLGGWGGCKTCSDVFNTKKGRREFAKSVKEITAYFKTDGIDLDWEYPAIEGFPGHTYRPEDRDNFTALLKEIRKVNGKNFEISFAAGGFTGYIDASIDWNKIIKYTNFINIMSYDLTNGFSTVSGHHTPLYSTPFQIESTDHAVQLLLDAGVPANQLVIGAAFYGRFFQIEEGNEVDLNMPCHFFHGLPFKNLEDSISVNNGFEIRWDDIAKAPYAINEKRRLVATYDDQQSIALKTKYVVEKKLGGIMFWQLAEDKFRYGLLDAIFRNK
jgi:chitinase